MLFAGATLVALPFVLREHSERCRTASGASKSRPAAIAEAASNRSISNTATAIFPLEIGRLTREKSLEGLHFRGGFEHFREVSEGNLQHKDSKKVLFPYEIAVFSSSIRSAAGE
ncbi:MAG: hypothetical protein V4614_08115 [Pseudomonadota bacterium]